MMTKMIMLMMMMMMPEGDGDGGCAPEVFISAHAQGETPAAELFSIFYIEKQIREVQDWKRTLKISARQSYANKNVQLWSKQYENKHTIDTYLLGKSKEEKITIDKCVAREIMWKKSWSLTKDVQIWCACAPKQKFVCTHMCAHVLCERVYKRVHKRVYKHVYKRAYKMNSRL